MPVVVTEKYQSRDTQTGQSPAVDYVYTVTGSDDTSEIETEVLSAAPTTVSTASDTLSRLGVTLHQEGNELWEAIVRYGFTQTPPFPQTGESSFQFETGGGSERRTHSLETVNSYPSGAPDFKGAIGVTPNGVEGVDVVVPQYTFSEVHFIDDASVTTGYKSTIANLTGKVNNATFKGFAAGEVLFLGASGAKRASGDDWEITFRFAAQGNQTGLEVGDITGIAKKGWEYLWTRFEDTEDTTNKALVKTPQAVYIEQVYPEGDFSGLGI